MAGELGRHLFETVDGGFETVDAVVHVHQVPSDSAAGSCGHAPPDIARRFSRRLRQ
jgi:hypothetical protein